MAKYSIKEMVSRLESKGYQANFRFFLMPIDAADRDDVKVLTGKHDYEAAFMFLNQMLPDGLRSVLDGALYIAGTNIPHNVESYAATRGHSTEFVKKAWATMAQLGLIRIVDGVVCIKDPDYWYGEAVGLVCRRANENDRNNKFNRNPNSGKITKMTARPVKLGSKKQPVSIAHSLPVDGGRAIDVLPVSGRNMPNQTMHLRINDAPAKAQIKILEAAFEFCDDPANKIHTSYYNHDRDTSNDVPWYCPSDEPCDYDAPVRSPATANAINALDDESNLASLIASAEYQHLSPGG